MKCVTSFCTLLFQKQSVNTIAFTDEWGHLWSSWPFDSQMLKGDWERNIEILVSGWAKTLPRSYLSTVGGLLLFDKHHSGQPEMGYL